MNASTAAGMFCANISATGGAAPERGLCKRRARFFWRFGAALPIILCSLFFRTALPLRADELADCTEDAFRDAAVTNVLSGDVITFPADCSGFTLTEGPVDITSDDLTIDGGDNQVTLAGAGNGSNNIFIVESNANLTLNNLTLTGGQNTNGGAIYVFDDATLTLSNCVFFNNSAVGTNGDPGTNGASGDYVGHNGKKGSPGQDAFGGAIFNLGTVIAINCRFLTNSATGGDGGNGGDGGSGSFQGGNGASAGRAGVAIGGAIFNSASSGFGILLLSNSTFAGNSATGGNGGDGGASGGGGAIAGTGGNGGGGGLSSGAGVYSDTNGSLTIVNCTFSENQTTAGNSGSGAGNAAGSGPRGPDGTGGGVANSGFLAATNCTFFENSANGGNGGGGGKGGSGGAGIGGGIYNLATIGTNFIVNCTFANGGASGGTNGAGSGSPFGPAGKTGNALGGSIANVVPKKIKAALLLANSIVATNLAGGGAGSGKIQDGGYNICADRSIKLNKKKHSLPRTNPKIGALADNGGPMETIALAANSPAIDKIPPALAPAFDERGMPRPLIVYSNYSDIGAFELDLNTPHILTQPQNVITNIGAKASFSVTASGASPLAYQWFFQATNSSSFTNIPGATGSTYAISKVQTNNVGSYQVVVTNNFGAIISRPAMLTLTNIVTNAAPVITAGPTNRTVVVSNAVTFGVTATGTPPLGYVWTIKFTNSTYTTFYAGTNGLITLSGTNVTFDWDKSQWSVTVTNGFGLAVSTNATLTVITNLSGPPLPVPLLTRAASQMNAVPVETFLSPLVQEKSALAPANFTFTFQSQTGLAYVVEYKASLAETHWIPIRTNPGTGDLLTNQIPVSNEPGRFFRVRVVQE